MGKGHTHASSATGQHKQKLAIVLGMTFLYLVAEVVGGLLTKSLALLADAGHMLTDVMGLALALFAIRFAERPASPERTYGYYRVEILAALANAMILIGISLYILYEAYKRFHNPPEVQSLPMLLIAGIGLVINIVGMLILQSSAKESLNMKGAYFEVLSDMLTSIGVMVAGLIMLTTGWFYADPLISAGIGLFILPRTWALLKDVVGVLLEGVPSDVNIAAIRESFSNIAGVIEVHDLHVWSLTSGMNAMSVHIVLDDNAEHDAVLPLIHEHITKNFNIKHLTIQTERGDFAKHETHL